MKRDEMRQDQTGRGAVVRGEACGGAWWGVVGCGGAWWHVTVHDVVWRCMVRRGAVHDGVWWCMVRRVAVRGVVWQWHGPPRSEKRVDPSAPSPRLR